MFGFGSIVLTRFPFTDLSGDKRRPALVISRDNDRRTDLVVCFITSVPRTGPDLAPLGAVAGTGLKVPSVVRFDKLATLDRSVIAGKLGEAPAEWLATHRQTFLGVFGLTRSNSDRPVPHCPDACITTGPVPPTAAVNDWRQPPCGVGDARQ